ncbi:MAG TPA: hypothetical protein PLQ65_07120 [Flavihumibacter sp.]|nr:hypothetical protein [Flavihumibacter sp.]HQD09416.1 hypothetical protein [Flavihumibacter sp.]
MENQSPLNNRVDEILNSFEGMQSASASPHLYTRIRAALTEEDSLWVRLGRFLSTPAVALMVSLLLILINVWFILLSPAANADQKNEQLSDIAAEYHLNSSNLADQSNTLP